MEDQGWECWRVGDEGWERWRVGDQDCRQRGSRLHRSVSARSCRLWLPDLDPSLYHILFFLTSLFYLLLPVWKSRSQFASTMVKKKKCINGKLCAHQSPNFSWFLVFSSINPKCAFHFIFPPFEDICLAFALWDWEGGQGHWVSSFSTSLHWSEGPRLCPQAEGAAGSPSPRARGLALTFPSSGALWRWLNFKMMY